MRHLSYCRFVVGMVALACCGGCLVSPDGTAANASTLDAMATQAQTFVLDFVRQMLAAFMM